MKDINDRSYYYITLVVLFVHGLAIYLVCFFSTPLIFEKASERIVVKTVALAPPPALSVEKKTVIAEAPKPQKKVEPAKKKSEPKPQPAKPKEVAKTKTPSKPTPQPKESVVKNQKLLAEVQKSLAAVNTSKTQPLVDLKAVTDLQFDKVDGISADELGYQGVLAAHLRKVLRLPEYGDVRVRLVVARDGSVVSVETLSSANNVNKAYLEKMLPTLKFPPFGKNFGQESRHPFTLTMTNDR